MVTKTAVSVGNRVSQNVSYSRQLAMGDESLCRIGDVLPDLLRRYEVSNPPTVAAPALLTSSDRQRSLTWAPANLATI